MNGMFTFMCRIIFWALLWTQQRTTWADTRLHLLRASQFLLLLKSSKRFPNWICDSKLSDDGCSADGPLVGGTRMGRKRKAAALHAACLPPSLPPSLQPKLSKLPWKQNGMIHRDRGEDWPRLVEGVSNRYDHLHHLLTSRWRHSGAVGAWIIVGLCFLPSLNLSSFLSDSLFPLRPPWAFGYFFSCSVGYCVGCSDAAIISVSAQFRWNLKSCTSCVPQLLEMSKFKFMVKLPHSLIKSVAGFAFGISIEIYFVLN